MTRSVSKGLIVHMSNPFKSAQPQPCHRCSNSPYRSGWQEGGHDHQTPDLTRPDHHLMRPGIDKGQLEALKWLMREAEKGQHYRFPPHQHSTDGEGLLKDPAIVCNSLD